MSVASSNVSVRPSAIMTSEEIAVWQRMDRDDQLQAMREVLQNARTSGISTRSLEQIKEDALAKFESQQHNHND